MGIIYFYTGRTEQAKTDLEQAAALYEELALEESQEYGMMQGFLTQIRQKEQKKK